MENKGSILVIDDEAGIRQGCYRALQPQGFMVETAESFQDGLQKIQAGAFDLILLDVMLPDGSGVDLLGTIQERNSETIPIIITGYATIELAVDSIKQGAYSFISKPFTADMLLNTVNQGLEKKRLSQEAKRLQAIESQAAELTRARDEAKRLDDFKSSFLWMVTHELRSPISGAQSLVRTLLHGLAGSLNPQQFELLTRVEVRLDFLLELVNDLLTLAANKSIETEPPLTHVQVQPLLRRVVDSFAEESNNRQVTLKAPLSGKQCAVLATEKGLESIFRNLIGNAIKYTPAGGRVEVESVKGAGHIKISVADTGMGIPEEDLPHIWEEFFRSKNAHLSGVTGTGLGLSIVRQLMDRFGGQISVTSSLGLGTTFTVSFKID
jgi:signal transduction histidine kinase